ncbi:MAG TPA: sterol desaturase family protein, partial [Rhodospirillales bacterium]|nr:sterol desaturase family protein [Rhodospirillales bacterium]
MESFVLSHEMALRLAAIAVVLAAMMGWERWRPRRLRHDGERFSRWRANLGLVAVDAALVRLIFPLAAVGAAALAEARGWGLLNAVALPEWLAVAI